MWKQWIRSTTQNDFLFQLSIVSFASSFFYKRYCAPPCLFSHGENIFILILLTYFSFPSKVYPVAQIYDLEDTLLDERKVEKQPMSFNPQWNDELLFALNGRPTDSLQVAIRLLELDSFSNEHVIGQIKMPLTEANMGNPGSVWYDLTDINKVTYRPFLIFMHVTLSLIFMQLIK